MATLAAGSVGDKSINDISTLIRLKERELHEIHDLRCAQLEKLVEERDHVLLSAQGRFEQLKEDFRYNLTLLEARDQEIARLEQCVAKTSAQLADCETERRGLVNRVELLELRDVDRAERAKQDQLNSKRILQELKDVIESMRWAAVEESKTKQREIDSIKDELVRATSSREESLDSQRRDLTRTFEQLLQQREDAFLNREREFGGQVISLDSKFEQLSTDNSRLRSELAEASRRVERFTEDLALKEEAYRHLQWRVEDERVGRQQADDSLQRRLQAASLELAAVQDAAAKERTELQAKLDSAQHDSARERDFRILVEKRLEESRGSLQQSVGHLEAELLECRGREMALRRDMDTVREERESALERCRAMRLEADSAAARAALLEQDCLRQRTETADTSAALAQAQARHAELEQSNDAALKAQHRKVEQLAQELRELDEARASAALSVDELEAALEQSEAKASRLAALLAEEREESEALRLRLRLRDAGGASAADQLVLAAGASVAGAGGAMSMAAGSGGGSNGPPSRGVSARRSFEAMGAGLGLTGLAIQPAALSSPAFSEDFGPVSLPASPDASALGNVHHHHHHQQMQQQQRRRRMGTGFIGFDGDGAEVDEDEDEGAYAFGRAPRGHPMGTLGISVHSSHSQSHSHSHSQGSVITAGTGAVGGTGTGTGTGAAGLAEENDRLRLVVREMRADVEALQAQVQSQLQQQQQHQSQRDQVQVQVPGHQGRDGDVLDSSERELGQRLQAAMAEVARLRAERRTLMDVSNELRAELHRARGSGPGVGQAFAPQTAMLPQSQSQPQPQLLHHAPQQPRPQPQQESHAASSSSSSSSSAPSAAPAVAVAAAAAAVAEQPQRRTVYAWTDPAFDPAPAEAGLMGLQGQAMGLGLAGHSNSGAPPRFSSSGRTTASQQRARQQLQRGLGGGGQGGGVASGAPRRTVMNYARGEESRPAET